MSLIFLINSIDVVKEDEVFDFLQEIDLMKNIGKHQNVIQMYGCCTTCRPICLVLEYAPGGNLLNYLRSLKKKVMYRRSDETFQTYALSFLSHYAACFRLYN